ncbi:hypothetical protein DRO69_14285 [Candidatus Bathyarchaeota archaeon]|nr:MAG: hypothetical protein DRO69_14285 [Candidatus Bathyarchaeota archaeon]
MKSRNLCLTIIFSVVIALLLIYHLPNNTKELLVLRSDSLNVFALFSCHFVHEDFANHLLPNILAYFVAVLLLYWVLNMLNERRFFYKLFAFNCLAMPFILSLVWIGACTFWNAQTRSYGFSGITSAFLGALIFAYVLFLHKTLKLDTCYAYLSAIFLAALLFTLTYFTPTVTVIATAIALLAVFGTLAYKTVKSIDPQARNKLLEKIKNPKIAAITADLLLLSLYLVIFLLSLSLFPTQIVQGNTTVNILIHYAGFVLGIGNAQLIWQYFHKAPVKA